MASPSTVLVIGATGYIGKFIVPASVKSGYPTFALVRDLNPSDPSKAATLQHFKDLGVTLVQGDLYDHESLVKAIQAVDVVISTVGYAQLTDQTNIIAAIKQVGTIKRFLPSEFGNDVDRVHAVDPAKSVYAKKAEIRRIIEKEGIPFTFVSSNFFAGRFLPNLGQIGVTFPPKDKVTIFGDGNTKAVFVDEEDVANYTIKAIDDPRTLNKILYMRPPKNTISQNELVSIWEKIVGEVFERVYLSEEEVMKRINEVPVPLNIPYSILHSVFIKGDHTNFEIESSFGVETTQLYPDYKYTSVEEYLNKLI
ncbi:hypothetical protein LUZ60_012841 [Juncus effusus]|nr:hypothetical protein LUZ60_012841 [Juncus effusus]